MEVKGYELAGQEKLDRVVLGKQNRLGQLEGGLGLYSDDGTVVDSEGNPVDENEILARYDREGGLILKDSIKIKNGAFWDSKFKRARKEPDIWYLFPVGAGDFVEVRDPKELGKAIQTIEAAKQEKVAKFKAKKSKSKFKEVK